MKKLFVMMLATVLVAYASAELASAAVISWDQQVAPATNDWNTAANWNGGAVPGAADHVIIHNATAAPNPVISGGPAPSVNILGPSWHNGQATTLNILAGSSVGVNSFARLSGGNNSTSTVNFHPGAGVSVWSTLQMSFDTAMDGFLGDSFINIDGGILHLGALGFSNDGSNTTNIDIGAGGTLLVNGDHTAKPWISNSWITGIDGTGVVNAFFDTGNGRTVFTAMAVPEPASLALLGLGMVAVLGTRRRP